MTEPHPRSSIPDTMHGGNLEHIAREHGIAPTNLMDFSTGINPLGFPPHVRSLVDRTLSQAAAYPDPAYKAFRKTLTEVSGIPSCRVLPGNGSSELLLALLRALCPPQVITTMPAYIDYAGYSRRLGIPVRGVRLKKEKDFVLDPADMAAALKSAPPGALAILGNPNNPTGRLLPAGYVRRLASAYPRQLFCVDEAYRGFTDRDGNAAMDGPNILRLRSLTKLFAVPGFRIAYLCGGEARLALVHKELPIWNVGTLPIHLAQSFIQDRQHVRRTRDWLQQTKTPFYEELRRLPNLTPYPTDCNFLLFQVNGCDPKVFYDAMIKQGVVLRSCEDFEGLEPGFFRTAIRLKEENARLFKALGAALGVSTKKQQPLRQTRRRAALMFQGTSSSAGKSLMTAAFCRVLSDRGISAAPFKAQNMSLNSYVTAEGKEMGRAQVLQAAAARVEPHVLMNPVLLKPTGDQGSQVILRGKSTGNLTARAYYQHKKELKDEVRRAYDELAAAYDAIVLEGAGSPGEINLREHDIVNMSMAGYANAPVILVGDIDRGGVYASFVGHLGVMAEWERNLVKGFLVNKFRGDATLLDSAHEYMFNRTGKPVVGVMPWVRDHRLPEEDQVDFNLRYGREGAEQSRQEVVIGFVDLPRVSNSTDLDPFLGEGGVRLVKIDSAESFRRYRPGGVIIPGSKNVIADLRHIRKLGITEVLEEAVRREEIVLVGICGGFQMLGRSISDPSGLEAEPGAYIGGMGLLNLQTVLEEEKTLRQTETRFRLDNSPVAGYEIHHGQSNYRDEEELFETPALGCRHSRVWGTYLHGVFDNDGVRRQFLSELRRDAGVNEGPSQRQSLDEALDEFTAVFRENVDVGQLMKIMGL